MKRVFASIIILFGLFISVGSVETSGEKLSGYTTTKINIRNKPNGEIVDVLPTLSNVSGYLEGNWIKT